MCRCESRHPHAPSLVAPGAETCAAAELDVILAAAPPASPGTQRARRHRGAPPGLTQAPVMPATGGSPQPLHPQLVPAEQPPPVLPSTHAHLAPAPARVDTPVAPAQGSAGSDGISPAVLASATAQPATAGDANLTALEQLGDAEEGRADADAFGDDEVLEEAQGMLFIVEHYFALTRAARLWRKRRAAHSPASPVTSPTFPLNSHGTSPSSCSQTKLPSKAPEQSVISGVPQVALEQGPTRLSCHELGALSRPAVGSGGRRG